MFNYWVAYTQFNARRYACLFTDFKDSEKYLKAVLESDLSFDFREQVRDNFTVKCFEVKEDAVKFRDKFLECGV